MLMASSNEQPRSEAARYLDKYTSPPIFYPSGYFNASPAGELHDLVHPAGEGRDWGAKSQSRGES